MGLRKLNIKKEAENSFPCLLGVISEKKYVKQQYQQEFVLKAIVYQYENQYQKYDIIKVYPAFQKIDK